WFTGAQVQRQATGDYNVRSGQLLAGRTQSTGNIDRTYFVQYDYAQNQGTNAPPSSSALSANVGWTGRYFNNRQAPTRGWGLAVELGTGITMQ
ncbi:hypothetical protein ACS2Q2_29525, partial [Bacillus cereus group sp. Bce009]|uniref:hypothetical protein n=1 Tax=Bacillus cereus group sp. Bce009 TaxID=3445252 RepID=UPI003F26C882